MEKVWERILTPNTSVATPFPRIPAFTTPEMVTDPECRLRHDSVFFRTWSGVKNKKNGPASGVTFICGGSKFAWSL